MEVVTKSAQIVWDHSPAPVTLTFTGLTATKGHVLVSIQYIYIYQQIINLVATW